MGTRVEEGPGARGSIARTLWTRRGLLRGGATAVAIGAAAWLPGTAPASVVAASGGQIEPTAGTWKPWVLASGSELRPPPPPDQAATNAELDQLRALAGQRDAAREQIAFWDAGAPSYRWVNIALDQLARKPMTNPRMMRLLALMNVAIADALVAAWDAKYAYNRPRPSEVDTSFVPMLANPVSPSYPSEHAVAAGAASTILASLYPDDAQSFVDQANAAAQSRLIAGLHFPSDVQAGLDLGRTVADRVIERAKGDGSDAKWAGSVPIEPGHWNGANPMEPLAGTWKTWVLASGDQFRPGPPPAYDSPQEMADLAELKGINRTFDLTAKAFFWQTFGGIYTSWYDTASRLIFERGMATNAPRAARLYALMAVAHADAVVACWDAKYTYWAIRPPQLDPSFAPLFPPPPHPSYPAAHATVSSAIGGMIAYAFPGAADAVNAKVQEAAMSRMWAGIHFRSDIDAGFTIGKAVAQAVIDRADGDGAQ